MKSILMVCVLTMGLFTSSCSTLKESLISGMGTGAVVGGTAGIIAGKKKTDALIGLAVGGVVGAISGYFIYKGLEKRDRRIRQETLLNLEKFDVSVPQNYSNDTPMLTMPVVEEQWVDSQVKNGKLIESHRMWEISEGSQLVPIKKSKRKK